MKLNLVVLYCRDIEASRRFYELLGLTFAREKHGNGPEHFAAVLDQVVLELYPRGEEQPSRRTRIGFQVEDPGATRHALRTAGFTVKDPDDGLPTIVKDPDGHPVHLTSLRDA